MENLKIGEARSVWAVHGSPQDNEGNLHAERSGLFLLHLTAEPGDAANKFIKESGRDDKIDYRMAKILYTKYIGWVWVD